MTNPADASSATPPSAPPTAPPGATAAVVPHDLLCVQCDHNLRSLPLSGKCPECGASIQRALASRSLFRLPGWFRHAQLVIGWLLAVLILVAAGLSLFSFYEYLRILIAGTPAEKATSWGHLLILLVFGVFGSASAVAGLIITLPVSPLVWKRRRRLRVWQTLRWLFWACLPLGPGLLIALFVIELSWFSP